MQKVNLIRTARMDTTHLPVDEQFQSWASHSQNSHLTPQIPGAFLARGAFWDLGNAVVAEAYLDPFVSDRTLELVRATNVDYIQIVAIFEGSVRFQSGELDQICQSGAVFVRDYAYPSCATSTNIHCVTVSFRRQFIDHLAGSFDMNGALPSVPESALLNETLRTVVRYLPYMEATSAPYYAKMIRDLLAAATMRAPRIKRVSIDQSRKAEVQVYISAQPPGALFVPIMLDSLRMTRSTLYRLFRQDGGVLAYDRVRRLRALYHDITDPSESSSIAELGAKYGFLDKTVLARMFKTAFGCSASELRMRVGSAARDRSGEGMALLLRETVQDLRTG